jgi:hypothetical protein
MPQPVGGTGKNQFGTRLTYGLALTIVEGVRTAPLLRRSVNTNDR